MGIYNAYINGNKVTSAVLTPGWTSYKHRVQYQTYDVTALLDTQSRIEIGLGLGWAVGCLSFGKQFYADHTSLTAQLDVLYTNGNTYTVVTDEQWQVYTSNVTFAELYHGETLDKTAEVRLIGNAVRDKVDTLPVPQVGEWITEQE